MFVALVKAKTANRKIRGEHDEGEKKVADSFKVSTFGHFVFFLFLSLMKKRSKTDSPLAESAFHEARSGR